MYLDWSRQTERTSVRQSTMSSTQFKAGSGGGYVAMAPKAIYASQISLRVTGPMAFISSAAIELLPTFGNAFTATATRLSHRTS